MKRLCDGRLRLSLGVKEAAFIQVSTLFKLFHIYCKILKQKKPDPYNFRKWLNRAYLNVFDKAVNVH